MKFRADEGEATPPRMRVHGRSPHPAEYAAWREMRRNTRQVEEPGADAAWNHLISVFVHGKAGAGLVATLESLRSQTYRNIEIIVGGPQTAELPPRDDFASLRGMFPEPEADPLTLLADPASDRLWRGSHIMFAQAGTLFDDEAFELLNALLNQGSAESRPDLVLCDHDRLGPGGAAVPHFLPGWDPDLVCAMDVVGTAFLVSRRLLQARRSGTAPGSLREWLIGVAQAPRAPHWAHLAEPAIQLPDPPAKPDRTTPAIIGRAASVAIVIPNRNRAEMLGRCVQFIGSFAGGVELVIVDHASTEPATLDLYQSLRRDLGARIVPVAGMFNFSRMVNLGVAATSSEMVLLLNNDVEVTRPGQIETLVGHAMRPEVGVAGARLLYPDGTVQHAGMMLECQSSPTRIVPHHVGRGAPESSDGYLHGLRTVRNYQAVTGALLATRRAVFDAVNGFDEVSLPVEYNDVDFCLKVRQQGLRVVTVPTEGIVHRESATRDTTPTPDVLTMRNAAEAVISSRWPEAVRHDPFRHPWVKIESVPQPRFAWHEGPAP